MVSFRSPISWWKVRQHRGLSTLLSVHSLPHAFLYPLALVPSLQITPVLTKLLEFPASFPTLSSHLTTADRQSRHYPSTFPSPPMALVSSADLSSDPSFSYLPACWRSLDFPPGIPEAKPKFFSSFSLPGQFLLLAVLVSLDGATFLPVTLGSPLSCPCLSFAGFFTVAHFSLVLLPHSRPTSYQQLSPRPFSLAP